MIDSTLTPTVAEPPGIVSLQSSHVVVAPQHVVWAISRIWQVGDGAMPSPWAGFAILFPWNLWQKGPIFLCLFSWHWSKCTHTFGFTLGFPLEVFYFPIQVCFFTLHSLRSAGGAGIGHAWVLATRTATDIECHAWGLPSGGLKNLRTADHSKPQFGRDSPPSFVSLFVWIHTKPSHPSLLGSLKA